jgi:hypothetical protein
MGVVFSLRWGGKIAGFVSLSVKAPLLQRSANGFFFGQVVRYSALLPLLFSPKKIADLLLFEIGSGEVLHRWRLTS